MPFYEYKCVDCFYKFTELQSIHDEPLQKCPKCKSKVKKIFSLCSTDVNYKNGAEHYEKVIKPDAKKVVEKINNGDENAAADILGEN